ncbi:TnsA-like heteromeric transposase endonuclease subunit [Streptomyces sp. NBC_01208]|uniref:TnsA-like heteromeric transposase endonuclease subunit n=1 Tax=Streptomyces sp. NBC_01208 TaxID=2903773 RepID=UPI002E137DCA|nr:TnsA-like heteromeric transposase endonuclease subunit [Streptomyces sp. NBC_01208]
MGAGLNAAASITVSQRGANGILVENREWVTASIDELAAAAPWRTFRWYSGQRHYSGTYWSATMRDHVIYESRLELARLLFADFDPSVRRVVAQPFLLKAEVDGAVRKHIPDYLLVTDEGPVVVDVKPLHRLSKPGVAFTFGWTREVVEVRGWKYEVWSEPPAVELENVRFLSGFRRDWLFDCGLVDELRGAELDGVSLRRAAASVPGHAEEQVRSAVHHLLWTHEFTVDLDRPISPAHVLRRAA